MGGFTLGLPEQPATQPAPIKKPRQLTPRPKSPVRRRSRTSSRRRQSKSRARSRSRTRSRPYTRRRSRSYTRRTSRSYTRRRSLSASLSSRRLRSPSEIQTTVAILKMFWWLVHGVIALMILNFETTQAHNFVALLLLMPEFSVERVSISSVFRGSKRRGSLDGAIFFFYFIGTFAIATVICGAVSGLLWLGAQYAIQDLSVMAGFSALATTCVVGPVEMIRFISRAVGWLILLVLTAMYVQIGLMFIPVFYVIILAVSALDYFLWYSKEPEPEPPSIMWWF